PCLDVHDGQVTRGVQFGKAEAGELRNVGDPVALAMRYNEQGADEMVFFDITASAHGRKTMVDVIERTANECFMPLTVGGGIKTVDDMYTMLRAGLDTSANRERHETFVGGGIKTVDDMYTMLRAGLDT